MRNFKIKFSLLISVLFLSSGVSAEEDRFAPVRDKLQTCIVCHGENGVSIQPTIPILAGQEFYYLYVQLKDFKTDHRKNEIMSPIVSGLEKDQMKLIAEYFSEQTWPGTKFTAKKEQIVVGKKVIDAGQCIACHLGAFNGNSRVPRLANQHVEYLKKTMLDFKNKVRTNSAAKVSLLATFSDEEISAVAEYLAGFKE